MTATGIQTAAAQPAADSRAQAERAQIERLAHEFEAMLISQMLRGMRQSMLSDGGDEPGLGAETMTETLDEELAGAMSRAGGIGLAKVLVNALGARPGLATTDATKTPPGSIAPAATVAPAAPDAPAAPAALAAPVAPGTPSHLPTVTSGFGWRQDPFDGRVRFHSGADFRLAYGEDVRAISPGTVVFAGEQRGYGLTVMVDDGAGLKTRYAHLSSTAVKAGDQIEAGAMLAKSGSSGRSTGPHLHLEVVRDGRPIDPALVLKEQGAMPIPLVERTRSSHED